MNIYDVSEKAGVSIATVSRVLNGSDKVSEKTKRKVLEVMEEGNYTPNVFARGLGLNSMRTIGIMCPDASDTFLANGVYYAEQTLREYGYDTILNCSGYKLEQKKKSLQLLQSKRVDAVIMIGSTYVEKEEEDRQYILDVAKEIPIAIVNGYMEGENVYCAFCHDFLATFQVTSALLDKGRRRILYLYRSGTSYSGIKKRDGYKTAFLSREMSIDERYMVQVENNIEKIKEVLYDLEGQGLSFDGILTSDDVLAIAGLKYAKEKGLRVPEDIDIIGYNNSIISVCSDPELTSIDSKVKTTTISAVRTLIDALEGREAEQKICVPCEIVKRQTTKF